MGRGRSRREFLFVAMERGSKKKRKGGDEERGRREGAEIYYGISSARI